MDTFWKTTIWQQFGAAIDTLERAICACPDDVWFGRSQPEKLWYFVYHTLFFLDYYMSDSADGFAPPEPFSLDELDPAGILPERPYTKDELLSYLEHGRAKSRAAINALTDEKARQRCCIEYLDLTVVELYLYNMRHVQHHAAQLNLILRQSTGSAPRWVVKAGTPLRTD